jgi:hypothetical protein
VKQSNRRRSRAVIGFAVAASIVIASCGGDDGGGEAAPETTTAATSSTEASDTSSTSEAPDATPATIRVPDDFPTIQEAVDAAKPGDLVLIAPGVYNEAVNVTTDELTIRGLDRNEVILDGNFELDNGIRVLGAKGVALENMTAKNYTRNGFFWTGGQGYRGSYLTAIRNGDYGVYAFDIADGILEHIYASGSPDAGVYIGQCYPCNAIIRNVLSEHNGLGYSGTNSGGNLYIVDSVWRFNRAGIVPNSGSYELCYPQRDSVIVGNLVYSNNQPDTPAIDVALLAMGNGIIAPGGVNNVIERNRVFDHDRVGIALVPFLEEDPNDAEPAQSDWSRPCAEAKLDPVPDPADVPSVILWNPYGNRIVDNVVEDSREADMSIASVETDYSTLGNCFSGNSYATTAPFELETLAPCDGEGSGDWTAGDLNVIRWIAEQSTRPPSVNYREAPLPDPGPQPNMPDAATAPARPAVDLDLSIDIAAYGVPAKP